MKDKKDPIKIKWKDVVDFQDVWHTKTFRNKQSFDEWKEKFGNSTIDYEIV